MKENHPESIDFRNIVREVIQLEYGLKLYPSTVITNSKGKFKFDFVDKENNGFVEIFENAKSNDKKQIIEQLVNYKNFLLTLRANISPSLFVVFNHKLSQNEKIDIIKEADTEGEVKLTLLDQLDIQKLVDKYNIDVKYDIPSESEVETNYDDSLEQRKIQENSKSINFELDKLINSGRSFYVADHLWSKNDQLYRFIKERIWESEQIETISQIYEVNTGDILFTKLTFSGYLQIDAIGVVTNNPKDGQRLFVKWHNIDSIELYEFKGDYRGSIDRIKKEDVIKFLRVLLSEIPNLFEIINELDKPGIQDNSNLNETQDDVKSDDAVSVEELKDNRAKDKDKIPFHLDQVVDDDKLGREPVAKAFVNLIKKDVFTEKLNHSFMVHLQGEWGAGKSSFLNFIRKNLNTEDETWIVVNYNAWQNQHITPPWWTLIDQIYRQSEAELKGWDKCKLWIKENRRRIIWYNGWQKMMALVLTITLTIILIVYGSPLFNILTNNTFTTTIVDNEAKGLTIEVFAKLLVSLSALIGVIYSFSKFISTPFFLKSSKEADSFMLRASDPMTRIKNHFSKLVDNINSKEKKRQLAIFIDDIDRCNKEFIVQLLEGIQTLFKDKRVLYIVAGDKRWITTSFGNAYKEFSSDGSKSDELGELFLEKAFQLSFRMPNVEEDAKKEYWNFILGLPENKIDEATKIDSFEKLSKDQQTEVKEAITNSTDDITNPDFMKNMEVKFNLTRDIVSDMVIEEKNSNSKEIRHLLKGFHSVIDANPRSIIRLANNYTMTRSTLIAERKNVSADKIFRWLVIEDLFPKIKLEVNTLYSIDKIQAFFEKEISVEKLKKDCINLLIDEKNETGGSFEMEEIKDIIGF